MLLVFFGLLWLVHDAIIVATPANGMTLPRSQERDSETQSQIADVGL